jgi:hypothetical protein
MHTENSNSKWRASLFEYGTCKSFVIDFFKLAVTAIIKIEKMDILDHWVEISQATYLLLDMAYTFVIPKLCLLSISLTNKNFAVVEQWKTDSPHHNTVETKVADFTIYFS